MLNQVEYYRDQNVRSRIVEYCGGHSEDVHTFTAEYLVGYGEYLTWKGNEEAVISSPNEGFDWILRKGLDIFRSLWDKRFQLVVLDIEYFNMDFGGEIYWQPLEVFRRLEPVYQKIMSIFKSYGMRPLMLVTEQNYHFVFRFRRDSPVDNELARIGQLNEALSHKYGISSGRRHRFVSYEYGKAYDGLGRVMEQFVYKLIHECRAVTNLPIVITDVAVGPGQHGREAISFDLSAFGDPVYMRDIRCAFSTHQKHKVQIYKVGEKIAREIPVQITIPRTILNLTQIMHLRRHFRDAADYAAGLSCRVPIYTEEMNLLIKEYRESPLFKFHQHYDDRYFASPQERRALLAKVDLRALPPCVRQAMEQPNPHLLKPTNLQMLTRVMLKWGWHPRDIAGVVWSKYEEKQHGWEEDWDRYDEATRANFYVRLFAGMMQAGLDNKMDCNCVSHKEKGFCLKPWCGFDLSKYA
ncbi:MAG TPA: hypothetical protein PKM88_09650 [bacterium]|nr:hypothetical protein [bacterium]